MPRTAGSYITSSVRVRYIDVFNRSDEQIEAAIAATFELPRILGQNTTAGMIDRDQVSLNGDRIA